MPDVDAAEFYAATQADIDDLALGLRVLDAKARELRGAFDARQTLLLHRAASDLARLTEQLETLSNALAVRAHIKLHAPQHAYEAP